MLLQRAPRTEVLQRTSLRRAAEQWAELGPKLVGKIHLDYGDRAEHCWNGDHENGTHIARLRYNTFDLPESLRRIEESAPKGRIWRVGGTEISHS